MRTVPLPTPVQGGELALLEDVAASAPGPFVLCAVGVASVRHGNLQGRILICISFSAFYFILDK